jgi:hypothetical protein
MRLLSRRAKAGQTVARANPLFVSSLYQEAVSQTSPSWRLCFNAIIDLGIVGEKAA